MQDVVEVRLDLRPTDTFVKSRFRPAELSSAATQHRRRNPVEHRRLVQLDERIRILPMTARRMASIDERDVHVRVLDARP